MIEEDCGPVHDMLNGGLAFPKATEANPHPEQPRKDGWWDNIHDSVTYPIEQLVSMVGVKDPRIIKGFRNGVPYTEVVDDESFEGLGFNETARYGERR